MKTSRNAPCPCGSGQKYKKCCLPKVEAQDFAYGRISQAFQSLTGKLFTFAEGLLGPDGMDEAIDNFLLWEEELDDADTIDDLAPLMVPWAVYAWDLTPADIEELDFEIALPPDTSVAELYLRKKAAKIDSLERHILESVGRLVFSFHEVTAVVPGSGFECTDILTGQSHSVSERTTAEQLAEGAILFCAIARIDDLELLAAVSPVTFPLAWKTDVIDLREFMQKNRPVLTQEDLFEYDGEIRDVFLALYARATRPPALTNTDGEPLVPQTLYYAISDPQEAFDALKHLCVTESQEDILKDATRSETGVLLSVSFPWVRDETAGVTPMSNTILAHIDIDETTMIVEVNSENRAAAIREVIEQALGAGAQFRTASFAPLEDTGDEYEDEDRQDVHDTLMQDPVVREHLERRFLEHWEKWVDAPLPALDGETPRQAMATPTGREKVATLIRNAELNRNPDMELQRKGIELARRELGL